LLARPLGNAQERSRRNKKKAKRMTRIGRVDIP
jgi:hypothetical protein